MKPCPFCGSQNIRESKEFEMQKNGHLKSVVIYISCQKCFAKGPSSIYDPDVEKSWNERKLLIGE